jgi:hypothetical protein
LSREVIAGEEIKLRTRFRDDLNDGALASGVWLHIFEPSVPVVVGGAGAIVTTSGELIYIGEGIWEYGFTPHCHAPTGTWTDAWSGLLNSQLISGEFNFTVYGGGDVVEIGDQLFANNLVEVILDSGIMATDGTYLSDGYSFEFLTTTNPSYTNIRKVRLEVGSFLNQMPDLTIQLMILEASLEADQLDFSAQNSLINQNSGLFQHARREWVTCKTALGLIDNTTSNALKTKTLGDLHVEYDTNVVFKTMQRIIACLEKWEPQLISGGLAKASQQPRGVIKGEYDRERPQTGRLWESTDGSYSDPYPAANTQGKRSSSHQRYKNLYKKGKKFW